MKFEIHPVEVSALVPFSPSPYSSVLQTALTGVSRNGLWMWIIRGSTINLYHTVNSEWFGGYCFQKSLKNNVRITAVTEFCSSHISFSCLLIALNQDDESLICMYDINKSKVVRAVLVPEKVISIEIVSRNGGACMDNHYLFMQLRYLFGIIAIGTSAGHVFFLDLCLDEDFCCDENFPNITFVLKKYELLPEHREMAISKQQHICMLLNDQSVRNGSFEFESRSSSLGHFPYGKVHVTALKYIQNSVTLAVGFNFGGIQLWDLQDLCLLYTVSNQPQEQPIVAFAFQEPENDPRHFCYLWIIRGHSVNDRPKDFSVATMYSLVYDKRTYVESFGYLYTELRNCFKRFEYRMTSDPFSPAQSSSAAGSCLLACQTVSQIDESHCFDVCSLNESDAASESMSLCFLSWVVLSHSENVPTSYHLALFDLNQWYRAEMPSSNYRSEASDLNPYFAHFSLEEAAQIFDLDPLLGLYVIPHSIKKFKYNTPSEEFFFPSALDYQTVVYSSTGICKTTFMGLQRRLLYKISDMCPSILVNPKDIYLNLIRCGLVSDPHMSSDRVPLIVQRENLMQLALEYHMPFFFIKCFKEWRYADSIQEGCTSRALLNWAWKKVMHIKNSIDKLTIPLFNCSDSDIDKGPLRCLYSYRRQLDLIDAILMGYQKFAAPRTEQGIQELKCRKDVVFCINMYLQVMLWLRSVHVLPEVCEGDETEKNILYPATALLNSYSERRNHLKKIHNSIGPTDILLIDGLIKEAFKENTWVEKGGNGIYPPPSIYAALSCYLLDDVPLELKHSLMYYLLLDICDAPHNRKNDLISKLKKFPSVFGMSQSVSKLVKAFWYLDRFNFEIGIKKLLKPGIKSSDIQPWQHHRVIKSFLFQGEAQKALKYINHMEPPENSIEDMKLHLSVLIARGAIIQAFDYQRSKQSIGCGTELLNHLFLGCQETHKLKDLIYMPLNTFESSALVKFLSENEDLCAQETLIVYHLLCCNYFEAAKVNEKLSVSSLGRSSTSRERTAGRNALVEGLLSSVSETEKNLIKEINRFPSTTFQKLETVKPLSLSVKSVPMKQVTYSDILNTLISEASTAMCAPYLDSQVPLRSINRSSYENIPFLRPPLTPEHTKIPPVNTHSTPVAKRTLTSPTSEFSSPSKKSRLLDGAPFRTPLSKKKVPKHLAGDVASLLQSPPIPRRRSSSYRSTPVRDSATAPQGILKKKTDTVQHPASDFFSARTPSVLSDADENSDDGDDNEMNVDNAPDDNPARQIRFSVPSKEELNASTLSSISSESAVSNVSHEPTNFMKKLEELKPLPSLEPIDFKSRGFLNVTQRKTLLGLTREPLKSHSAGSVEKTLPSHEHNQIAPEVQPIGESASFSPADTFQHKTVDPTIYSVETSDSDSCSAMEEEPNKTKEIISAQSSSLIYASSNKQITQTNLPSSSVGIESPLNKSGSSSGNSSYNSVSSERSFLITPRRPLRDNNRNTSCSSSSMLSAQGSEKDHTLLGNEVAEEMIIDDNTNDHSGGEEEISIIGEVSVPPFNQNIRPSSQIIQRECISVDVPYSERTNQLTDSSHNQDIHFVSKEEKCESMKKPFLHKEDSLDVEQVFDSHEQDNSANRLLDNERIMYNIEQYDDVQNQFYDADRFNDHHNEMNDIEQLNVSEDQISDADQFNVYRNAAEQIEESDDIQNQIYNDEKSCDIQNQISDTSNFYPNQVTNMEQYSGDQIEVNAEHFSEDWNQVDTVVKKVVENVLSDEVVEVIKDDAIVVDAEAKVNDNVQMDQTVKEVTNDTNEKTFLEELKERQSNIDIINAQYSDSTENAFEIVEEENNDKPVIDCVKMLTDSIEAQTENPDKCESSEILNFAKDVPVSNLPQYIPIKERISKSQQSVSQSSKFNEDDNDDDQTYPSLLLQEQMELEKYGESRESDKISDNASKKPPGSSTEFRKLESVAESSQNVEAEFQDTNKSIESNPSTGVNCDKDLPEKITEPFNFLSKDSEFYENNKLYKETMALLKSDMPTSFDFDVEKKSSRKTRTFVFKKEKEKTPKKITKAAETESKVDKKTVPSDKFLDSWQPETYEQFSSSIQKGRSNAGQKEALKSSPNADLQKSSISIFKESNESEQSPSKAKGRRKESTNKEPKKELSSIKKAKGKGKTVKKMEFSFADPHSPAGPEVLEALTTPSQYPVGSFMFSPPLTRGRLRKKKMDESLGSSFASAVSETSFVKEKKPPVDSILQEIIEERTPDTQKLMSPSKRKSKASTKKKTASKKSEKTDEPEIELSDSSIDTSRMINIDSPSISSIAGMPTRQAAKHRMVLRQSKTKSQTEQIF